MKIRLILMITLCTALSACTKSNDSGTTGTDPTAAGGGANNNPLENQLAAAGQTSGTSSSGPDTSGPGNTMPGDDPPPTGNQSTEDQLLNQGTSQSPSSAWVCTGEPELVFGFFGQGDGIVGVFNTEDSTARFSPNPYTIDTAGNVLFTVQLENDVLPIGLAPPEFTDESNFTTAITRGTIAPYPSSCRLAQFEPSTDIPPEDEEEAEPGDEEQTPPMGGTDPTGLDARLRNGGTFAVPTDGWSCEGTLLGFYGSGQGRIGQGNTQSGTFNPMDYTVEGDGTVTLSANNTRGSLSSIQFEGPDAFGTTYFDGQSTQVVECSRFELRLAKTSTPSHATQSFATRRQTRVVPER